MGKTLDIQKIVNEIRVEDDEEDEREVRCANVRCDAMIAVLGGSLPVFDSHSFDHFAYKENFWQFDLDVMRSIAESNGAGYIESAVKSVFKWADEQVDVSQTDPCGLVCICEEEFLGISAPK